MRRDEALRILSQHKDDLKALGVESLAIFGSVARDEARPDSDVDIMVDLCRPIGMFAFLDIKERLESLLGYRVDLITRDGLKQQLRESILREAVRAA